MTSAIQTPTDLVNMSLRRIGYKLSVGSLYEGSEASAFALDIYAQTRDEFLRASDADFSEGNIALQLLKQAPDGGYVPPITWSDAYPPLPWVFEYAYPDDCLKVRSIRPQAIFVMEFDPHPITYSLSNDNSFTPAQKVLLCNTPSALLTYTRRVTDLTNWEPDSIEAFAAALGRRLVPSLLGLDALKAVVPDEQNAVSTAEKNQG